MRFYCVLAVHAHWRTLFAVDSVRQAGQAPCQLKRPVFAILIAIRMHCLACAHPGVAAPPLALLTVQLPAHHGLNGARVRRRAQTAERYTATHVR